MDKFVGYAKHLNASQTILDWVVKRMDEKIDTTEGEHVIDYLVNENPKISTSNYEQVKHNAEKWLKTQMKKGEHIKEKPEDTQVVLDFKDGFKIVQLVGKAAYEREGYLMRHCVASYFGRSVKIYSLRDRDNLPHCTMEQDQQVKGKGNGDIHPKYVGYVVKFLEHIGMTVGDSEMRHLGYINAEKFIKDFNDETKKQLFNKKYLPKNAKWMDKNGEEFIDLDILDQVPLVEDKDIGLKVNFELKHFIKLSIDFLFRKNKKVQEKIEGESVTSGHYAKNASSGHYAKNASSGDYAKNASSGHYATNASSGHYATNASSGDYARNASSGDYATNASSGDYARNASSGDYAKNASSGHYATNASSGHYATNASSGHSATNASSGHYATNASSGHSATNASSGHSATNASSGHYAKNASSGHYAKNASSGDYAKNASSGHSATNASSGHYATNASSGHYATNASSGHSATNASSGHYAKNASSGHYATNAMEGNHSVSVDAGHNGKVKGKIGCWFALTEWVEKDGIWIPLCVKAGKIDGKKLKEDVWYKLEKGKFVEVKEN
jgi:hypothetical protein